MRSLALEECGEKRQWPRLNLELEALCRESGKSDSGPQTGYTLNVSPGGALIAVQNMSLEIGSLIEIEMSVPPTPGMLEAGGRFHTYGRVLRSEFLRQVDFASQTHVLAVEFCEQPRLCI